jgi:glycosyltransferase involved in cell wall biosynthesis
MQTLKKSIRVALVTNIPTPYREPVFGILAAMPDIDLKVIYCSQREPDREWHLRAFQYASIYMKTRFFKKGDKFIHANPGVLKVLHGIKPDVVIASGFNPTHLLAFFYAKIYRCDFIPMTDGTWYSEQSLSIAHKFLRKTIYAFSSTFIAASDGGFDLYQSYGIKRQRIFKSHLCADNSAFMLTAEQDKIYDLIFSGRLAPLKNPLFVLDVAQAVALRLQRRIRVAFLGSGPMREEIQEKARQQSQVDCEFLGFVQQQQLPRFYGLARVMLFPTLADVWGIVANEALAAGLPIIVSPVAGCVPELVRHQENGFVLPVEVDVWADAVVKLLENPPLASAMGQCGRAIVSHYTYNHAAQGIADAVRQASDFC